MNDEPDWKAKGIPEPPEKLKPLLKYIAMCLVWNRLQEAELRNHPSQKEKENV